MEQCSILCQDSVVTELRAQRRTVALSKTQIIEAAVEILDAAGVEALTFRALAAHLSTGAGAIYHHVANKSELLAAAANDVMSATLMGMGGQGAGRGVRVVMLAAFDAISTHPWVGTQLAAAAWQPAVLQLFERVGAELEIIGVPERAQFDAASVLVYQVLGVASQFDAGLRLRRMGAGRGAFLESVASELTQPDVAREHPFMARIAWQLAEHDDREQFRAGVEITLAGITNMDGHPARHEARSTMRSTTEVG